MSDRGRSTSRAIRDADVEMGNNDVAPAGGENSEARVVVVKNLSRNVLETHLQTVFGFYGQITKIDLPVFGKCECGYVSSIRQRYLSFRV